MKKPVTYSQYPLWVPVLASGATLLTYAIGFYLILAFGLLFSILYLVFCGWLEYRLIRYHCVDCYYYNKACAFGKGKLSAFFFKKGSVKKFTKMKITVKDFVPDLLAFSIPVILGIISLFIHFNIWVLSLLIILIILNSFGTGFIRGEIACKHCKQGELGCPALKFFEKRNKSPRKVGRK